MLVDILSVIFKGSVFTFSPISLAHTFYTSSRGVYRDPVLILHGLFGCRRNWRSIAQNLNLRGFDKVICVDLRNHGDSPHSDDFSYHAMADDVHKLVEDLGLRKVSLIGHSMGGKVAMTVALKQPTLMERLVVVDVAPNFSANALKLDRYASMMISIDLPKRLAACSGKIAVLRNQLMEEWKNEIEAFGMRAFLLNNLAERNGKAMWNVNLQALIRNLPSLCGFPFTLKDSNKFSGQSLFIAGQMSRFLLPESMPEILHFFPRANRVEIPNAGHWVNSDAPEPLCDTLSFFFTKVSLRQ